MLVPLTITALLTRGHFIRAIDDPSSRFSRAVETAVAQDVADARLAPEDDTPTTAAQIPALREALTFAVAARFDLAAALLVAHATGSPNSAESGWALRRAYLYWHALGRNHEADLAIHQYETHHAAREPRAAAEFFWSRREHLGASQRRDHLRRYLELHALNGPPDLRFAAEAELAADLWRESCAHPWQGLCVDFGWVERRGGCYFARIPVFTIQPRDPELRLEALRRATAVTRRARTLDLARVAPWRRPALREALGKAALISADDAIEALFALEYPFDLEYSVEEYKNTPEVPRWQREYREQIRRRDESLNRLRAYFRRQIPRFDAVSRAAEVVADTGSARAILTTMVRLALVYSEVQDEEEFSSTSKQPHPDYICCFTNRPLAEVAVRLRDACVDLSRTTLSPGRDADICHEGFGSLEAGDDPPAEFHTPA